MPAKKKAKETAAQVKTLEAQLWDAADKMRGAVPPTDYMHVCLGMVSCATSPLRLSERKMS
jgi:type I restriction-modification system DNA methylase subunit